jgi:hypothetical protein
MLNTQATIQKNANINPPTNILQNNNNASVPAIINNFNIIDNKMGGGNNSSTIIVEHDKSTHEFTFKNLNKNILGSFNILQLFKFLNNEFDSYLTDVNIGTSDIIISKYLYNPSNDITKTCDLISHLESPFTGNIELLVKLYTDIIKIEDKINEEILTKPRDIAEKIKEKNNKFIYNILIRILKLANTLTEQFKDDHAKREILIKYSVGAAYKLSVMTQDDLSIKKMQYETIQTDIDKLKKIQESINTKLNELKQTIDIENSNINVLINHLSNKKIMHGGNKSSSTASKSSNSLTSNTSKSIDLSINNLSMNNKKDKFTSDTSLPVKGKKKNITSTSTTSTSSMTSSTVKTSDTSLSNLNINYINDIQNETNPTENTRSLIKSINIGSSYDSTSYDTFTITD